MTTRTPRSPKVSPLQRNLTGQVVDLMLRQDLPSGAVLTELGLAKQLGVSRSPVRAALGVLARAGLVDKVDGSWRLQVDAASMTPMPVDAPVAETERLFVAIARDRVTGRLPREISEAELMRRYKATRPNIVQVLMRLLEVGQVDRKTGHGWTFLPPAFDVETRNESYRFRVLIEPAALLEPGFRLDPAWITGMRARHEAMLAEPWVETLAVKLFDLNAEFHEGLAAASGNPFFAIAVVQQNRLRRFVNVHWRFGVERVAASCLEHLEILAHLESGEHQAASDLMRAHLQIAGALQGSAALPSPDRPARSADAKPAKAKARRVSSVT